MNFFIKISIVIVLIILTNFILDNLKYLKNYGRCSNRLTSLLIFILSESEGEKRNEFYVFYYQPNSIKCCTAW